MGNFKLLLYRYPVWYVKGTIRKVVIPNFKGKKSNQKLIFTQTAAKPTLHLSQMQYIGEKIQELLKEKDLKQQALAREMNYRPQHLSKKIGLKLSFSEQKVLIAAKFLGVTPEYLRDESRPYYQGDKIPADAIMQPPTAQERQGDSDAITKLFILAEREMEYRTASNAKINPDAMIAAQEELAQEMRVLSTELRLLREEMARSREEDGGNHDADFWHIGILLLRKFAATKVYRSFGEVTNLFDTFMKDTNLPTEPPQTEGDEQFRSRIGVATKFIQTTLYSEAEQEKDPQRKEAILNCHLSVSTAVRKLID